MASSRKYHGIHKQQLFHWLASRSHRAAGLKRQVDDAMRREYLDYLRSSLESGLWVKSPRDPESIALSGASYPLTKAIACFTEWSLDLSRPHTTEYGPLGFGFSKAWLIKRGGQPVTYFDHSPRSPFLRTLIGLLKRVDADPVALDAALYLAHFTKRIHKPMPTGAARPPTRTKGPARPARRPRPKTAAMDAFARFWSKTMPYLEEREWRIVEHPRLLANGSLVANAPSATPKYFLPYKPGIELFTLVLPDNQTVSEVLRNTWFAERLFPKNAPHVTVLSLQDIGTF